jgi:endonuclease/exonuclease/phosphatase family metal-dependent hydrolase
VMTWNLWWRFGPFEQRQQAIVDVIRSVDPDILCLQEVWSDATDDQSEQLAEVLGMHSTRTDPVFYDGQSFGNAILTRWPVDRIASEALPNASSPASSTRPRAAGRSLPPTSITVSMPLQPANSKPLGYSSSV